MKNIYEHKKSQSQSLNAIVTENNNKKIPFSSEQKSNDCFEMHTIYLDRKEMKKFDKSEREKMPLRTQYQ